MERGVVEAHAKQELRPQRVVGAVKAVIEIFSVTCTTWVDILSWSWWGAQEEGVRGALCFGPAVAVANVCSLQDQKAKACWWAASRRTTLKGCILSGSQCSRVLDHELSAHKRCKDGFHCQEAPRLQITAWTFSDNLKNSAEQLR